MKIRRTLKLVYVLAGLGTLQLLYVNMSAKDTVTKAFVIPVDPPKSLVKAKNLNSVVKNGKTIYTTQSSGACLAEDEVLKIEKTIIRDLGSSVINSCRQLLQAAAAIKPEIKARAEYVRLHAGGPISGKNHIKSFHPYMDSPGTTYDCRRIRLDQMYSRHMDLALREASAMSNWLELLKANKAKDEVLNQANSCISAMFYQWGREGYLLKGVYDGIDDTKNPPKADDLLPNVDGLRPSGNQTEKSRSMTIGGLALIYMRSSEAREIGKQAASDTVGKSKDDVVVDWLNQLGQRVLLRAKEIRKESSDLNAVNTQMWRGFTMLPIGLMSEDDELIKFSRSIFLTTMKEINPEGHRSPGLLPRELRRGPKAYHYHVFSAWPTVGSAVLSKAYGCDFMGSNWRKRQTGLLMAAIIREDTLELNNVAGPIRLATNRKQSGNDNPYPLVGLLSLAGEKQVLNEIRSSLKSDYTDFEPIALPNPKNYENGSFDRFGGSVAGLWSVVEPLTKKRSNKLKSCAE